MDNKISICILFFWLYSSDFDQRRLLFLDFIVYFISTSFLSFNNSLITILSNPTPTLTRYFTNKLFFCAFFSVKLTVFVCSSLWAFLLVIFINMGCNNSNNFQPNSSSFITNNSCFYKKLHWKKPSWFNSNNTNWHFTIKDNKPMPSIRNNSCSIKAISTIKQCNTITIINFRYVYNNNITDPRTKTDRKVYFQWILNAR